MNTISNPNPPVRPASVRLEVGERELFADGAEIRREARNTYSAYDRNGALIGDRPSRADALALLESITGGNDDH